MKARETDPLKPLEDNASRAESSLTQLRGVAWQMPAVTMFVVLGVGQAIAARASVGADGQLPYDTAAAVSWAEIVKLIFAIGWTAMFHRAELRGAVPKAWVYESVDLFAVAVLFALQNELNFLVIEKLGAALFMILGNLKIVFTCIFMRVLIGKRFAYLQWLGVSLLVLSAIVVKVPSFLSMFQQGDASHGLSVMGLVLLLISTASSGLAAVTNELILKRGTEDKTESQDPQMPFMLKNAVLYVWGIGLNLVSWSIWGQHSMFACFTGMGVLSIFCLAGMGLACAVILRYLDNVVRCFSSVTQVLMTVILSRMLPASLHEGSFDKYYVYSLILLAVSLVIYQAHSSPHLWSYVIVAIAGAMCTGVLCSMLDA